MRTGSLLLVLIAPAWLAGGCDSGTSHQLTYLSQGATARERVGMDARDALHRERGHVLEIAGPVHDGASLMFGTALSCNAPRRNVGIQCSGSFTVSLLRNGEQETLATYVQRRHELPLQEQWVNRSVVLPQTRAHQCTLVLAAQRTSGPCVPVFSVPTLQTGPTASRKSVFLVLFDSLRADHLGCYGYTRPTSPCIDSLAASGVLFQSASSCAPWTLPSLGSILSSLPPEGHGAGRGRDSPMREDVPNLACEFRRAGYFTKAYSANPMLSASYGTDRGFREASWPFVDADTVAGRICAWLNSHRREPFFLVVFILDPHHPYSPPKDFRERFARNAGSARVSDTFGDIQLARTGALTPEERIAVVDLYDAEIAWADRALGSILAALRSSGAAARTVVVVAADHGEEFWDHGGFYHGHSLYDELLHVPLIVSAPRLHPVRSKVRQPVSLLDVAPTLLELAGLPVPSRMQGKSLTPLIKGHAVPHFCPSSSVRYADELRALRTGNLKVIATPLGQAIALYDLAADPRETTNLLPGRQATADSLVEVLMSHIPPETDAPAAVPDEETREALNALGYL
jgi:arylsulfatase A-like enzyme